MPGDKKNRSVSLGGTQDRDGRSAEEGELQREESSPPLHVSWNLFLTIISLLPFELVGVGYAIFKIFSICQVIGVMNNHMQSVYQANSLAPPDQQFEAWTFWYKLALVLCCLSMGIAFVVGIVAFIMNWKRPRWALLVYISLVISAVVITVTAWFFLMQSDVLQNQITKTLYDTAEHGYEFFAENIEKALQCSGYRHPFHKDIVFSQSDDPLQSRSLMASKITCTELITGSIIPKQTVIFWWIGILISITAVHLFRLCYTTLFLKEAVQQTPLVANGKLCLWMMSDTAIDVTSAFSSHASVVSAQKDFGFLDNMKNENLWFKDAQKRPFFQALLSSRCFLLSTIIGLAASVWSTVFFFVFICKSPRNEFGLLLHAGETVWEREVEDDYFMYDEWITITFALAAFETVLLMLVGCCLIRKSIIETRRTTLLMILIFIVFNVVLLSAGLVLCHLIVIDTVFGDELKQKVQEFLQRAAAWNPDRFAKFEEKFHCSGVRENFDAKFSRNPKSNWTEDLWGQSKPHPNCNFIIEQKLMSPSTAVASLIGTLFFAATFIFSMCRCFFTKLEQNNTDIIAAH